MQKKILAIVLCFAVLATMFTGIFGVSAETADSVTMVYVHNKDGLDTNDGLTATTALKTIAAAINRVNELGLSGENRVVYVLQSEWDGFSFDLRSCNAYTEMITIKSANCTLWTKTDMHLAGPLTIDSAFGRSNGYQNGLYIYTHGYDFVYGPNAVDNKASDAVGNTYIYTGYEASLGLAADETTKYIEYGKDVNISVMGNSATEKTVAGIYVGNTSSVSAAVQYGNANIVIDNPSLKIDALKIGNVGNYNTGVTTQMNRFNTVNLTVNNVAALTLTGATYYNAVYTVNLQMIYNNGTAAKVTDNIEYGGWPKMLQANNKWVLKGGEGGYLETTETAGTFKVYGGIATATDGTNTYVSANGLLTVPKGDYTVTYSLPDMIYLHDTDGNDANDGFTSSTPLKTLQAAVNRVNELGLTGENRVIYVLKCGWNGINFNMASCTPYDEMITLKSAGLKLWSAYDMYLAGPFTLDTMYGHTSNRALNVYTFGYDFKFGDNAADDKGNTSVFAGYDPMLGLAADETTKYIEYGKDMNIAFTGTQNRTVPTLGIGNTSYLDKVVQYGNANILIDNPNLTITTLKIGNNGNFKGSTQQNRFGTINLTVNNVAALTLTGATYYNAVYTANLQMIYNNGTAAKVTDGLTYGGYGNYMMQAANKWVLKSADTSGNYLETTETAGSFKVCGGLTAVASDGTNTYQSENGVLTVPKGTYTVTYEKMQGVYVDCTNGNDENDGQSSASPLKSLAAAITKINTLGLKGDERVITILKCANFNEASFDFSALEEYDEMITIRTKTNITVWSNSDLRIVGPLTFDFSYGKTNPQSGLNVYTHGYDFVLGENARDDKGTTSIYAGYDSSYDTNTVNSDTGYVEYGKDINVSVLSRQNTKVNLYIGNANYIDTGAVQYSNVNILIDAPYTTVTRLKVGNADGNFGEKVGARMNRYKNFNLTVNDVFEITEITGGTYYNGIYAENLQFVFNNETCDYVVNNLLTFGQYHDSIITANKRWIIKEETDTENAYLSVTETAGTFNVSALLAATADSSAAQYTSANGVLEIPAGDYTVTYTDPGAYVFANDVLTAVKDITGLNLTHFAETQANGRILIGWKNSDGNALADTSAVTLAKGQTLTAVYADFGNNDYGISNVEMRTSGKVGIRFTVDLSDSFGQIFADVSNVRYGYLVLPKHFIDMGETLTVDNANAAQKDNLNTKFRYLNDGQTSFSACVTDIKAEHYTAVYCVRGFVTYTDINGNVRTAYTDTAGYSLYEVAAEVLGTQKDNAAAKAIVDAADSAQKIALYSGVDAVADSVGTAATGTVYYVSENGDDNADGKTPETAWATVQKVNESTLSAGDAVLFERGGTYRMYRKVTTHKSLELVSGVSYGAYGTGEKPVINGSFENYAERTWSQYSGNQNIYYINLGYSLDPGVMRVTTNQNLSYTGIIRDSLDALDSEWEFYWDGANLYMYCPYAHPNALLKDIEIGFGADMFKLNGVSDIVIENIIFTLGGRHAISGVNNPANVTVRGCEFSYIGGCFTDNYETTGSFTRLGNGVEFLGSSANILVENCSFYSIYDSGVTFQGGASAGVTNTVTGFTVRNNVFDRCGLGSFEYWLGSEGSATDILIENNYMANAGLGHGGTAVRSVASSYNAHIRADGVNKTANFRIENNIFDSCADDAYILALCCNTNYGGAYPEFYRNTYIQKLGAGFMNVRVGSASASADTAFDADVYNYLKANWDKQPIVIYK